MIWVMFALGLQLDFKIVTIREIATMPERHVDKSVKTCGSLALSSPDGKVKFLVDVDGSARYSIYLADATVTKMKFKSSDADKRVCLDGVYRRVDGLSYRDAVRLKKVGMMADGANPDYAFYPR